MLYTVVTDTGKILLDKGLAIEFDAWMQANRHYRIRKVERRLARRKNLSDALIITVVPIWNKQRKWS